MDTPVILNPFVAGKIFCNVAGKGLFGRYRQSVSVALCHQSSIAGRTMLLSITAMVFSRT